jgi:hypothetical protein
MMTAKFTRAERIAHKLSWQQRSALRSYGNGRTSSMANRTDESLFRKGLIDQSLYAHTSRRPELTTLGREVLAAVAR